jgi:phosphatidylglycerophosphate synthase
MLDGRVRPLIDPPLDAAGAALARLGVGANAVTVAGFLLGAGACAAIFYGHFHAALALIAANRVFDGLDGAVARRRGATDLGGYLDIVLDMIFYSGVPFAFLLRDPADAAPAAFLMLSFMGTGASFLAYAAVAAKRGESTRAQGVKSMYYSFGLMEGTETIAFFAAFCLWPAYFAPLAWIFGALCWITVAGRMALAWNQFGGRR